MYERTFRMDILQNVQKPVDFQNFITGIIFRGRAYKMGSGDLGMEHLIECTLWEVLKCFLTLDSCKPIVGDKLETFKIA